MSVNNFFSNPINNKSKLTMEDIAKSKGASRSSASKLYHQARILLFKQTLVSNDSIKDVLAQSSDAILEKAIDVFKNSMQVPAGMNKDKTYSHQQKMTEDLAGIFKDHIPQTPQSKLEEAKATAQKAHTVIQAERFLKKMDPGILLDVAVHQAKANPQEELTGLRGDFLKYVKNNKLTVADDKSLKKAYESFVQNVVEKGKSGDAAVLEKMAKYPSDSSRREYKKTGAADMSVRDKIAVALDSIPPPVASQPIRLFIMQLMAENLTERIKKKPMEGPFRIPGNVLGRGQLLKSFYEAVHEGEGDTEAKIKDLIKKADTYVLTSLLKDMTRDLPEKPKVQTMEGGKPIEDDQPVAILKGNPDVLAAMEALFKTIVSNGSITKFTAAENLAIAYPQLRPIINPQEPPKSP